MNVKSQCMCITESISNICYDMGKIRDVLAYMLVKCTVVLSARCITAGSVHSSTCAVM
jgi:hypothetical protein